MLEILSPYMEAYSPRLIPVWNGYVSDIEYSTRSLIRRYMLAPGYETAGIRLLRYIFSCVDWTYMCRTDITDVHKYLNHVKHIQEDLNNTFEHTTTGAIYFNFFHDKTSGKTKELILPVEHITPLHRLPFDQSWLYWKPISPVRYLSHDSKELLRNFEQDRLKAYKMAPTYAVITIDTVALIFKYTKFLLSDISSTDTDIQANPGKIQRIFLHKYVLAHFLTDLLDIFFIKLLHYLVSIAPHYSKSDIDRRSATSDLMYGFVGQRYEEASLAILSTLQNTITGNIKPRSLLSSPLLTSRRSLLDRSLMILEELDIPRLRQFSFYRYLRDRDLFHLILDIFRLNQDNQLYTRLQRHIKPKVYKLLRDKIWIYSKDISLRNTIETDLHALNESLSFKESI